MSSFNGSLENITVGSVKAPPDWWPLGAGLRATRRISVHHN